MYRRQGFTLIEMLAAIAIVGLLAALTLMAVQAARESSRRLQCSANLRQIALAMNSYLDRDGTLPTAMMRIDGTFRAHCQSPFVRILPEIDQAQIYNAINFETHQPPNVVSAENNTAASLSIAIFLCPSDTVGAASGTGPMNYRVNMGSGFESFPFAMEPGQPGPFALTEWIRASAISDGLSMTCLVSERLRGDGNPSTWTRDRDPWFSDLGRLKPSPNTNTAVQLCSAVPGALPPHYSFGGSTWFLFSYDKTFYNHVTPPNASTPDCATTNEYYGSNGASDSGIYSARSHHGSGVNAATADGAVRWVNAGVATSVWRALGTRAGGEVVPENAF
jgi:prepilin-type N-terminal cleavage/methylation domain-containing protein